jgi:type IV pilus assembly protein PilM
MKMITVNVSGDKEREDNFNVRTAAMRFLRYAREGAIRQFWAFVAFLKFCLGLIALPLLFCIQAIVELITTSIDLLCDNHVIGIDIGSHSIKLVELEKTPDGWKLKTLEMIQVEPGAIKDNQIISPDKVVAALKQLVKAHNLRGRKVALNVSGVGTVTKMISLPQMDEKELAGSILWEAEQYIPYDIKTVNVDTAILDPNAPDNQMDVLLTCAKKAQVESYMQVVREADLNPVIVDLDEFAMLNMFNAAGLASKGTVAVVNVGASSIEICVTADGAPKFFRAIQEGSNIATEEIQRLLNVDWQTAEGYKIEGDAGNTAIEQEVAKSCDHAADVLASEIQRSLEFFNATSVADEIGIIYVCGGGSQLYNLRRILEQRLEVATMAIDPLAKITVDPKKFDAEVLGATRVQLGIAVGLALRTLK